MKAIYKTIVIAESSDTITIEDTHYFPEDSINKDYFFLNNHHTTTPGKGQASYFNLHIEGENIENAAWYYPSPEKEAEYIKNYVTFIEDIEVVQ